MNFSQPPKDVNEILKLIARTRSGRQVLDAFIPQYHRRKVTIEPYPFDLLVRLKEAIGPENPVGACFINDSDTGTIYLDMSSALGVLAPFLVHEMVHSLDAGIWGAARRPMDRAGRDRVMLIAETRAFECQHLFIREMKERFEGYQEFLNQQYPRARILHERLTSTDIAELYGFKIA